MLSLISLTVGKVKGLASTLDVYTENHIFSSFHCIYPHKFMLVCKGLGRIGWGPAGGRGLSVPASCSCPLSFSSLPPLGPTWLSKTSVLQRKLVPQGQRGPLNTVSRKRRGRWARWHVTSQAFSSLITHFIIAPSEISWESRSGGPVTILFPFHITHKYMKLKVPVEIRIESQPLYPGIDIYHH